VKREIFDIGIGGFPLHLPSSNGRSRRCTTIHQSHYAQFSTLVTIVTSVEACRDACGFSTKGAADTQLHEVTDLRNDVAHANLLVENTDTNELLSRGRTTENLKQTLETIDAVLSNLQEQA
jgi:hypothetical protein